MNAYYLMKPDGTRSGFNACGVCQQIALDSNFEINEKCCACYECKKPLGKEKYAKNILHCRECEARLRKEREQAAIDRAELIEGYDGPVYLEGGSGSYGEGYYADIDELVEWLDDQDDDVVRPTFVFCCEEYPFKGLDMDQLLEWATEEMFEDARDHLKGEDDLQTAIEAFNKANAGLISWVQDHKRKVVVPHSGNDPSPLT